MNPMYCILKRIAMKTIENESFRLMGAERLRADVIRCIQEISHNDIYLHDVTVVKNFDSWPIRTFEFSQQRGEHG